MTVRTGRLTCSQVSIIELISPDRCGHMRQLTVAGLTIVAAGHQKLTTDWSDVQGFDPPAAESTYSEDYGPRSRGPSSGVGCQVLSDLGTPEQAHCFSEGRRLLLGV